MRWLAAVCFILGVLAVASPAQGDHAHVLEGAVEGWRRAGYTLER